MNGDDQNQGGPSNDVPQDDTVGGGQAPDSGSPTADTPPESTPPSEGPAEATGDTLPSPPPVDTGQTPGSDDNSSA